MGDWEARSSDFVESPLGYHSSVTEILTLRSESWQRTVIGGQFDWGGRLPKSNGGAQRFPQNGWKPFEECKGRREPDCETDTSGRYESRA